MTASPEILQLQNVTLAVDATSGPGFCKLDLALAAGELLVVFLEPEKARRLLADTAEGLTIPTHGVVTFQGEDWQTMTPDRMAQQRGRIGRVFEGECWLSDLNVDQDIMLAERHHTHRAPKAIEAEALQLGRAFGLTELPRGRSAEMGWQDLRKASYVRAFLGAPILILLENPTSGLDTEALAALLKVTRTARQRGAAVLWTTDQLEVFDHPELCPTRRWRLDGSQMQVLRETAGTA